MTEKIMYTSRAGIHYDTALEADQADEREKTKRFIYGLACWQNDLKEGSELRQVPLPDLATLTARLSNIYGDVEESMKAAPPPAVDAEGKPARAYVASEMKDVKRQGGV